MILDEFFDRKLNNLFINSRDQDWSMEEFGQYFADFRQIVADSEQKKYLASRRLFREAFDCQSPSNRFRHYFKYILNERIICFEEFVSLLEGQSFKELDIQLKLLKVIDDSIEIILRPTNVLLFGNSLSSFINRLMEIYLASVENIPVKKQDISKKDSDVLNIIQQIFDKIVQMDNIRYLRSLLYVVKNDSQDKQLLFINLAKKINEKMAVLTEPTLKKLSEDFNKSFNQFNCDKSDILRSNITEQQRHNPFTTRLNSQNSLHLLSVWMNVECIKFKVEDGVDRLILLSKYFGLDFQTTMEVILITNIQKFTQYQEPIPDESELSYYTFAYHRLVPFIKRFVERRNELSFESASSPSLNNDEISNMIIEVLTNRIDWLKMIVNQMNGLLLVNFFFKLEKEKLVSSAQKLRQLIDPSFLDQSEETFFGKVLKFEQLVNDFLDNTNDKSYQISILYDLDIEISLLNFIISAKFMNKLEEVFHCLLNICEQNPDNFELSFQILISIILNDNNFEILNSSYSDSFILKFLKYFVFKNPKNIRKNLIRKFKNPYLSKKNEDFDRAFNNKKNGLSSHQDFMFFIKYYVKKNLRLFLKNPDNNFQTEQFFDNFSKLDNSYQVLSYLLIISYIYKEPFQHPDINRLLIKLKNILQKSELCQKIDLLSLVDRKWLKELREGDFSNFQEEKLEWNQKLSSNVKDSQTLTKQNMELYNDIFKRIGPKDFTKWITFTLFIGQHDVENMDNAVRLAYLLFQNNISECSFALINIVAEWLLFKSHSTHDFDQTRDDLNRCIVKLMLMCVNAVIKLQFHQTPSAEMEYLCNEGPIKIQNNSDDSMDVDCPSQPSLVITEFKRFLNDFVQINSSQDAIFRQTILTILFEETRNCFDEQTCTEFLPLFKSIVERLVKYATDGITYETIISFFPLEKQEFREHSANLLFMLNQSQTACI